MRGFFYFVYKQNPSVVIWSIFALIILSSIISVKIKNVKKLRHANLVLFILYFFVILFFTLMRSSTSSDIQLIPFHSFIAAQSQSEIYRSMFMNALLFVPLGLFMPYAVAGEKCRHPVAITVLFSVVLSAAIEFLQWRFSLGRCETDDVIFNTLGAAVGGLSFLLFLKIKSNRERSGGMAELNQHQKNLLSACGCALFGGKVRLNAPDYPEILNEAAHQTVLPLIESVIRKDFPEAQPRALKTVAKNIRVRHEHLELHGLLCQAGVPYVIIKGCASARYYPEPLLRTMGDVDFITKENHFPEADRLLRQAGFIPEGEGGGLHIGYQRNVGGKLSICEMHRSVNGIPSGDAGDRLRVLLSDIIDRAILCEDGYFVPCDFHHGLILLLHTASHLTHEGVGLRHLCDWAVFADFFSDEQFTSIFEEKLKSVGLWEFARALTAVCVRHLGAPEKQWAAGVDEALTDELILDILNGGNFGTKDADRYNQIKFIANRDDNKVDEKPAVLQLFYTLNQKAKARYRFTRLPILLPLGWVMVLCEYLYLLFIGKRSVKGIQKTIRDASDRKEIYSKLHLFEP